MGPFFLDENKSYMAIFSNLIQGTDYIIDELGNLIFTKEYHLKRGYCCQNGCVNCPFDTIDPNIPAELLGTDEFQEVDDSSDD
jgi:hypothetical protein